MVFTIRYGCVDDVDLLLDLYLPQLTSGIDESSTLTRRKCPVVVFFHGGGLTVGTRKSWFPTWLQRRVNAAGYAFISPDYRLLPPATGHEIVQDIKSLFRFLLQASQEEGYLHSHLSRDTSKGDLSTSANSTEKLRRFRIDEDAIIVAGVSAGAFCAYLAAMHVDCLKLKGLVGFYPMGGDFLTPDYLVPKTQVFLRGREMLDPEDFKEFLYPFPQGPPTQEDAAGEGPRSSQASSAQGTHLTNPTIKSKRWIASSALRYHSKDYKIPGYPANPRQLLTRLYLQMGVFLDFWTGEHEPSLTLVLRDVVTEEQNSTSGSGVEGDEHEKAVDICRGLIPERHHTLFPQFYLSPRKRANTEESPNPISWPPTFLVHGIADTAVKVHESQNMYRLLQKCDVPVELRIIPGTEHSFDLAPDAEEVHGGLFDDVVAFIRKCADGGYANQIE